jgi:SAM-dependent methyltransferase
MKIESKYDLDDPKRTLEHRDIILSKPFLKRIYSDWYKDILQEAEDTPEGAMLEIGSGGGFIKDINSTVITSDILELPNVDKVFSAEEMPFAENELSAIMMVNVFHHIPNVRNFLKEASRVLKKGGKIIMTEPANSMMSRVIYKNFHHEMFDEKRDWTFPQTGPLSGSNQALPYIVFKRDKKEFELEFPDFSVEKFYLHTAYRYILSGGVSRNQIVPDFMYSFFKILEGFLPNYTGMFQTIVIRKSE